ncbi:MAG: flippase activity-associated protein Agl23 [Haloferacaceae archaeon]
MADGDGEGDDGSRADGRVSTGDGRGAADAPDAGPGRSGEPGRFPLDVDALPVDRTTIGVLAAVALALALRLYRLGARVMHWDEGRVGYWILRYHESGQFHYRPIIHGPFLPIVNDYVFALVPPTDFSARLVVALVGGLLPLVALPLRDHLRDDETVALAVVLAGNPLLVYYSRFMRNDVLVGGFALVALALVVRALARGDVRLVYPAAGAIALAFTAKENALVYVVCFLGAGVLLLDHRLFRATTAGTAPRAVLWGWIRDLGARLRRWGGSLGRGVALAVGHTAGAVVVFLAVIVLFYAPRPDLWNALAAPATLPGVLEAATVGSWKAFYSTWLGGGHQSNPYFPFLYDFLETLAYGAPAVVAFAAVGFVADGYGSVGEAGAGTGTGTGTGAGAGDGAGTGAGAGAGAGDGAGGSRDLVAFATYWGAVSVIGYPIATDIRAPWAVVHAVVPLAIPAAVGVAHIYRRADLSLAPNRDDVAGPLVAALLVLAAATGVAGANATYANSASDAEGEVLQYAQPANDLKATLHDVEAVVERTDEGPAADVLFVGSTPPGGSNTRFYVQNESSARQPPVGGPSWHSRLPLPWYLERYGAETTSIPPDASLPADPPPVVIAYDWDRDEVATELPGYAACEHRFRLWAQRIVVFVDRDALAAANVGTYCAGADRGAA